MRLKRSVFPEGFPPGGAATHRRVFCLDFSGMLKSFFEMFIFWECYEFSEPLFFGNVMTVFSKCLDLKPTC